MKHVGFFYVNCGRPETEVLCLLLIASIRDAIKDAHITQMTNEHTKPILGVDDVIVRSVGKQGLMESRVDHYAHFPHEVLFLDPDIIVRKDPWDAFDQDFDVALTRRVGELFVDGVNTNGTMPYNTGVSFSRNGKFWKAVHKEMRGMSFKDRSWFGEQMAVANVVKSGRFNVLELSCADYNYSPNKQDEDVSEKYITHYKGPVRKQWMLALA